MPVTASPIRFWGAELHATKRYVSGTHRACAPEDTIARYEHLLPRFGITRLANITGLDRLGVPVYCGIRPNSRGLAVSQGKGLTKAAAKASAMMEAIESWHAEHAEAPVLYESVARMKETGYAVCDIRGLPRCRGAIVREDVPLLLVEGYDILSDEPCWVPWEVASTNFVQPPNHVQTFFMSSNGLASGNHLLEAITHGLCEVIERDALSLWHIQRQTRRVLTGSDGGGRLDETALEDPALRELLDDHLAAHGVQAMLWDITSDAGIPTFAATIFDAVAQHMRRPLGMFSGYGCHLSPTIALLRALTEAIQSRLGMIAGSRDDLLPAEYENCRRIDDLTAMAAARTADTGTPPVLDDVAATTFEGDVDRLLQAVRSLGLERVVVVDFSREDIGIPVVRVVVPGLEGIALERNCALGRRAAAASNRIRRELAAP